MPKTQLTNFNFRVVFVSTLMALLTFMPFGNIVRAEETFITASDDASDDSSTSPPPLHDFSTPLIIKSVNPGYGTDNDGELIELINLSGESLPLAGYSLVYQKGNNEPAPLYKFPDEAVLNGPTLFLAYEKSSLAGDVLVTYPTNIIQSAGSLFLFRGEELTDTVCWAGIKNGCERAFSGGDKASTLVRNLADGKLSHDTTYVPDIASSLADLVLPEPILATSPTETPKETIETASPICSGLLISELLTYYSQSQSEQFIEFFNPTKTDIDLSGCSIQYKKKSYSLSGVVPASGYFAFRNTFALTKNPSPPQTVSLVDADGSVVDSVTYGGSQKKETSYARFNDDEWLVTYSPTIGTKNQYQEFRTCPTGKVINPDTGSCINASTAMDSVLKPCAEGYERNPETNRCRKISTETTELKPCAEGYERNPETNRCRKVTSTNDGADYALVPNTRSGNTTFVALGVVLIIIIAGITYIILQFRREIARAFRKTRQRLHDFLVHLVARQRRGDGNKQT